MRRIGESETSGEVCGAGFPMILFRALSDGCAQPIGRKGTEFAAYAKLYSTKLAATTGTEVGRTVADMVFMKLSEHWPSATAATGRPTLAGGGVNEVADSGRLGSRAERGIAEKVFPRNLLLHTQYSFLLFRSFPLCAA